MLIPDRLLLALGPFGDRLPAPRVAAAIAQGLQASGQPEPDLCPINDDDVRHADLKALLDALDFNARMRRARAVVVGERQLDYHTLPGSATFEIATRARQAGVPAYAVVPENALTPFDARILDLQVILEAHNEQALRQAGMHLAELV